MNGIRFVEVTNAALADTTIEALGTDKFGQNQILIGIKPKSSGNLQRIYVTAEQWGNRRIVLPMYVDDSSPGGGGFWAPPIYPEVIANSTVTISGYQDGGIAEAAGCVLMFQICGPNGQYPAPMQKHIGEIHTQDIGGTATNGNFPTVPTGTQDVLNELPNDQWLPLMTAAIGDIPGEFKWSHPQDEGYPPVGLSVSNVGMGLAMFQPIAATNLLNGADTLSLLAKDDSGSAIKAFLYTGRVTGGRKAMSNRSPYSL